VDRRKNKKVTDRVSFHWQYIEGWLRFEQNCFREGTMHNRRAFEEYLEWLDSTCRLFLHPTWSTADIAKKASDEDVDNEYDTRTRLGSVVEYGPVCGRVARELIQLVNDVRVALGVPPSSDGKHPRPVLL
ncbi:hypothetical protein E2562_004457, partial [Oryza meyeriana var. granulata]